MKEYDVGISASTAEVGISASTKVVKNAVTIKDLTDPRTHVEALYEYNHSRWDWDVFNTYAYGLSEQRACRMIQTPNSKYSFRMGIEQKFDVYTNAPSFLALKKGSVNVYSEITVRTPY